MGKKNYFDQKSVKVFYKKSALTILIFFFIEIGLWILYDLVCNPFPKNVPLQNYKYIVLQDLLLAPKPLKLLWTNSHQTIYFGFVQL